MRVPLYIRRFDGLNDGLYSTRFRRSVGFCRDHRKWIFKATDTAKNAGGYAVGLGWALPDTFPPRNGRTAKALKALGYEVTVHVG
jgi:hypothetical protein